VLSCSLSVTARGDADPSDGTTWIDAVRSVSLWPTGANWNATALPSGDKRKSSGMRRSTANSGV
jgi:hypothetical protein